MKELVKTVLGRLSELGGEPDAEIAGKNLDHREHRCHIGNVVNKG